MLSTSSIDLKPAYPIEVAIRTYPLEYQVPKFKKFWWMERQHQWSTLSASLTPWALMSTCWSLFERILKVFNRQGYTWYVNLKLDMVHDLEHLVSLFIAEFFYVEGKLTRPELGRTQQYSSETWMFMWGGFMGKALICCDPLEEELSTKFASMWWRKDIEYFWRICLSPLFQVDWCGSLRERISGWGLTN